MPLGIVAALFKGRVPDQLAMTGAVIGLSLPSFWLGPMLALVFSVELGWFPVSGSGSLAHLVLPATTLGLALSALLARMTRTTLLDEIKVRLRASSRPDRGPRRPHPRTPDAGGHVIGMRSAPA